MKELVSQLDEERKRTDQYKGRLVKANNDSKLLEKQLNKSEEDCSRGRTAKKNVQRKLDDLQKDYEHLQREITKLKNKIKYSQEHPE